jgi:predicted nucleic acid-binding protein
MVDDEHFGHIFGDVHRLAIEHGLSGYDAAYLELAIRKGLPLATLDEDLQKAAQAAGVDLFQPA